MITDVESAIILAVPEAEPLVGDLRLRGDVSAAAGVPAHVTLLYPFVDDPDPGIAEELRFFFSMLDGFDLDFEAVGEFPEVVYLAPSQTHLIEDLIAALVLRWPDHPPYGGVFDRVVPHLTVVDTPDQILRTTAHKHVLDGLPLRARVSEASLWVHPDGESWRCLATFPLAVPEPD